MTKEEKKAYYAKFFYLNTTNQEERKSEKKAPVQEDWLKKLANLIEQEEKDTNLN